MHSSKRMALNVGHCQSQLAREAADKSALSFRAVNQSISGLFNQKEHTALLSGHHYCSSSSSDSWRDHCGWSKNMVLINSDELGKEDTRMTRLVQLAIKLEAGTSYTPPQPRRQIDLFADKLEDCSLTISVDLFSGFARLADMIKRYLILYTYQWYVLVASHISDLCEFYGSARSIPSPKIA